MVGEPASVMQIARRRDGESISRCINAGGGRQVAVPPILAVMHDGAYPTHESVLLV